MTFFKGSRYEKVGELEMELADGRLVRYKRTRFVPSTPARRAHVVRGDDRLDLLAFSEYRDPERFWLICDAGDVLWPPDLLSEPGQSIAIPPGEPGS